MTALTSAVQRTGSAHENERDDPLNTILDLVEGAVRSAMDLGLEAPFRARMARLLPAPVIDVSAPAVMPLDASGELALIAYQKRFGKFRMTELEYEGWKIIRAVLDAQLAATKQGRAKA